MMMMSTIKAPWMAHFVRTVTSLEMIIKVAVLLLRNDIFLPNTLIFHHQYRRENINLEDEGLESAFCLDTSSVIFT
jgi:hypothetical protein